MAPKVIRNGLFTQMARKIDSAFLAMTEPYSGTPCGAQQPSIRALPPPSAKRNPVWPSELGNGYAEALGRWMKCMRFVTRAFRSALTSSSAT